MNRFDCCLSKVESANGRGDIDRAEDASKTAKTLNIAGLICGIIIIIIYVSIKFTEQKWSFWYFPEGALQFQPFYALCFRSSTFTTRYGLTSLCVAFTLPVKSKTILCFHGASQKLLSNEKPQLSFDFHVHKLDFFFFYCLICLDFFSSNLLKKTEKEKNKYLAPHKFGIIKHNMNFLKFYCRYCYCWSHCIYRL